ncbi:MAG: hypothetical protein M1837_000066 [Sclerophora amabilis]|nr:MAG: hypothetical protein M1837_000066 [Sclerophora amabilis]
MSSRNTTLDQSRDSVISATEDSWDFDGEHLMSLDMFASNFSCPSTSTAPASTELPDSNQVYYPSPSPSATQLQKGYTIQRSLHDYTKLTWNPPLHSDDLWIALKLAYPTIDSDKERRGAAVRDFFLEEKAETEALLNSSTGSFDDSLGDGYEFFQNFTTSQDPVYPSVFELDPLGLLLGSLDETPPQMSLPASPLSALNSTPTEVVSRHPSKPPTPPESQGGMTSILNLNMAPASERKRRIQTEEERQEVRAKKRLGTVCVECKKKKKKCPHALAEPTRPAPAPVSTSSSYAILLDFSRRSTKIDASPSGSSSTSIAASQSSGASKATSPKIPATKVPRRTNIKRLRPAEVDLSESPVAMPIVSRDDQLRYVQKRQPVTNQSNDCPESTVSLRPGSAAANSGLEDSRHSSLYGHHSSWVIGRESNSGSLAGLFNCLGSAVYLVEVTMGWFLLSLLTSLVTPAMTNAISGWVSLEPETKIHLIQRD